ncbi:MAG TPA: DNA polymerase III subunit gamma/tau [Proteobacteria bacterium]|nr:DNA polymerase III subunit gamma/tau [Pseudomonadota bacterium]
MSYLVLARKYRPPTFKEVVGQEHVTVPLKNALKSGKIAHAYLFTGTRGVGKTTVARILAKALNCESSDKPVVEPCNKCTSCVQIAQGSSMDVLEIDGASYTSVDNIREIRDTLTYRPARGRYRIYIIDEVHMLSTAAFNALLKMLEEPPPHVIFIFATTEPHRIPKTVLSRVQRYDFKTIPIELIADALKKIVKKEKLDASEDVIWLVARKGQGSLRDAISYMDQVVAAGHTKDLKKAALILGAFDRNDLLDMVEAVIRRDARAALDVFYRLRTQSYDVRQFLWELLDIFRNLVVAKLTERPEDHVIGTKEEVERIRSLVKGCSIEELKELYRQANTSTSEVLYSLDPLLSLEMLVVRLASRQPAVALEELFERLNRIREKLSSAQPAGPMLPVSGTERSLFDAPQPEAEPAPKASTKGGGDVCGELLRHLKAVHPDVYSFVENLKWDRAGDRGPLVVYAPKEMLGLLRRSADVLNRAAEKVAGAGARVEIREEAEAPAQAQPKRSREGRPEKDQLVRQALDIFDADIVDIKRRKR